MTREMILDGNYAAAQPASAAALSIAGADSQYGARARLYYLIVDFLRGGGAAAAELETFDTGRLPPPDRELLIATRDLVTQARAPVAEGAAPAARVDNKPDASSPVAPTLEAGKKALAAATALLAKPQP